MIVFTELKFDVGSLKSFSYVKDSAKIVVNLCPESIHCHKWHLITDYKTYHVHVRPVPVLDDLLNHRPRTAYRRCKTFKWDSW